MLRFSNFPALGAAAIAGATSFAVASAQRPDLTLNPFVTFVPTGTGGPLTGLALTLASGPVALRGSAQISLEDRSAVATTSSDVAMRPWGADLDALAYLESLTYGQRIAFTPYVFAGMSTAAIDTGSVRINRRGWSYGAGMALPLASALGLFGEMRWRMSQFVLPNAKGAPSPTSEVRLGIAFHIGSGGGTGHAVPVISSTEGGEESDGSTATSVSAARLLSAANEYVGTPYRRGGTSPSNGFDAAGFVRFVFARLGVMLPRTSRDQARVGERISPDWHVIAPGDLVLFQDGGVNHVAIYAGRSRIIHSSETGGGVRYDDFGTERGQWFLEHLVAARRVTPDLRGLLLDLARGFSTEVASTDGPDHAPRIASKRRQ